MIVYTPNVLTLASVSPLLIFSTVWKLQTSRYMATILKEMASTIVARTFVGNMESLVHCDVIMPRKAKVTRFEISIVNTLSKTKFLKSITNNRTLLNLVVSAG